MSQMTTDGTPAQHRRRRARTAMVHDAFGAGQQPRMGHVLAHEYARGPRAGLDTAPAAEHHRPGTEPGDRRCQDRAEATDPTAGRAAEAGDQGWRAVFEELPQLRVGLPFRRLA